MGVNRIGKESFTRVLIMGVYHSRIEYPASNVRPGPQNPEQNGKDRDGDRGNNTPRGMADRRFLMRAA